MKNIFTNKTILITGGTGSFGGFFVKEILKYNPRVVVVFSRDEDKQYSMQFDLSKYKEKLKFVIGDIRDKDSLNKVLSEKTDYIIHAAALKQIPSSEYNVIETVRTNVIGAQNIVDAAIANKVVKVLSISTDKAVEPINVMGMTKGLQERIFTLGNKAGRISGTKFASVRYGNVIASRGSIIPLFQKQIAAGGPLTITDRKMTRFILTLTQASKLVFTALDKMKGGEIFIPDIKPLNIYDLASVMVDVLKPKNKHIIEIGIRPGEKLHETLISPIESLKANKKTGYYVVYPQIDLSDIGFTYKIMTSKKAMFRYSSDGSTPLSKKEIKNILQKEGIFNQPRI